MLMLEELEEQAFQYTACGKEDVVFSPVMVLGVHVENKTCNYHQQCHNSGEIVYWLVSTVPKLSYSLQNSGSEFRILYHCSDGYFNDKMNSCTHGGGTSLS